jgi:hypothetical protein
MSRTDRLGTQRDVEDLAAAALLDAITSHAQRTEADWQRRLKQVAEADRAGRTRPGACVGQEG